MAKQRQAEQSDLPPAGPEAAPPDALKRRCVVKMESAIGSARIELEAADEADAKRQLVAWIERSLTVEWK